MKGTPPASVFYSLICSVGIWIVWFLLFRDYRADILRYRLRSIELEMLGLAAVNRAYCLHPMYLRMRQRVRKAILCADQLTVTLLLLCLVFRRLVSTQQENTISDDDGQLEIICGRTLDAIAFHLVLNVPIFRRLITVDLIDAMLAASTARDGVS